MGSIFRITKAEFVKTFKRPTIYIMAFVLLITAVIAAIIFEPTARTEDRINYQSVTSANDVYVVYTSSGTNSKATFDNKVDIANNKVQYYSLMYNRQIGITNAYNNVLDTFEKLRNNVKNVDDFKQSLADYNTVIKNKYGLGEYDFINIAYDLDNYKAYSTYIELYITQCTSREAVITGFNQVDGNNKSAADKLLDIKNNSINIIHKAIEQYIDNVKQAHQDLYDIYLNGWSNSPERIINVENPILVKIDKNISDLYTYVTDKLKSSDFDVIYISKDMYDKLVNVKSYYVNTLVHPTSSMSTYSRARANNLDQIALEPITRELNEINSSIDAITLSKSTLDTLSKAAETITNDLAEVNTTIASLNTPTTSVEAIMKSVNDYQILTDVYSKYVDDTILLSTTSNMSVKEIQNIHGDKYNNYNYYEVKERHALNLYKLNNCQSGQETLNTLSFNGNSGYTTNGYDYMFYTLCIMAVLITIFAIMMTAISIGSEQDSGTIKLLLVRPFTRTQILIAKLLSVFFFILTFVIFSFIISLIAGAAVYGLPATNMLAVFNATKVFSAHPLVIILIQLVFIIFQVCFYTSFALAISVLFKNFATVLVSSLIVYLGGITCNILLTGTLAYKLIPFTNSYLFRYFGGSFTSTTSQLTNVFVSPIYSSMGFLWSILYCIIVISILNLISLLVFRNRDF